MCNEALQVVLPEVILSWKVCHYYVVKIIMAIEIVFEIIKCNVVLRLLNAALCFFFDY